MSDLIEKSLGEVYNFGSGLSKPRSEFGFGYDFLSFKDVFQSYFLPEKLTALVNTTDKERKTCSIKKGDVFLTRTSETQEELGMSSVALKDYPNATFNGFTKRLRPKNASEVIPEYAAYYFRSPKFRAAVTSISSLTTRASLNNEMLASLKIILPPVNAQYAISEVLKSLDDKIDLLNRSCKTSEQLTEILFRQWFLEEVDETWEEIKLGSIVKSTSGYNHKIDELCEFGDLLLSMGSITKTYGINLAATRRINSASIPAKYHIKKDDVIITTRDITQNADLLGSPGIVPSWLATNAIIGSNLYKLELISDKIPAIFLYLLLRSKFYREYIKEVASGTSILMLKKEDLFNFSFRYPLHMGDEKLQNIQNILDKLNGNQQQIHQLVTLRDSLLPRLLNGTLKVNNPAYDTHH